MTSRRVLLNLAAFLAVSLGLTAYGLFALLRDPFAPRTTVKTVLPDTAGLIKGLTASSNGVTVGTVTGVKLNPDNRSVTVTVSPVSTPARDALPVLSVAFVVASYTLLLAVMPVTVNVAGVMFAVVVGCVSV